MLPKNDLFILTISFIVTLLRLLPITADYCNKLLSTDLLSCCERSGLEAESELLSFSSVLFLFCSGERTGDGRLPFMPTGSFRLVSSSLCSVELAPWERSGPACDGDRPPPPPVDASGGEVGGSSFKMSWKEGKMEIEIEKKTHQTV